MMGETPLQVVHDSLASEPLRMSGCLSYSIDLSSHSFLLLLASYSISCISDKKPEKLHY